MEDFGFYKTEDGSKICLFSPRYTKLAGGGGRKGGVVKLQRGMKSCHMQG